MRVRRMPMHLSSGQVTLMPGKFYPLPSNFSQSDLGRRANSRWALPQISSFFFFSGFFWLVVRSAIIFPLELLFKFTSKLRGRRPAGPPSFPSRHIRTALAVRRRPPGVADFFSRHIRTAVAVRRRPPRLCLKFLVYSLFPGFFLACRQVRDSFFGIAVQIYF